MTATGDPRSASRLRSYGADQVIDHTATRLPQAVAGQQFGVVLSLVRTPPAETAELTDLVADGGTFLSTIPGPVTARDGVRMADLAAVHHEADAGRLSGKTILTP